MRMADTSIAVGVVLLLVCRYSFAQGDCTPNPPSTLTSPAVGTSNGVPSVVAPKDSKSFTQLM